MTDDALPEEQIAMYARRHEDASVPAVLGRFVLSPNRREEVAALVAEARGEEPPDVGADDEITDDPEPTDPAAVAEAVAGPDPDSGADGDMEPRAAGIADRDPQVRDGKTEGADGLPAETVREHYARARPVYDALATVGSHPTTVLNDYVGWYIKRDASDLETVAEGFDRRGRTVRADRDLDAVLGRLDRSLYALTSYKDPGAFGWEPCTYDDGTEWRDEKPTPDYGDVRAFAAWGDIDLADDVATARAAGDLDAETRATVEDALAAYAEEFGDLCGRPEAVQLLDSVGGAYAFTPPEATLPIAGLFEDDEDALERVMTAFVERSNEWLAEAEERVNERVPGAADVLDPDWCNNVNRQYKAPLSIHADHPEVVTPLDPAAPEYDLLAVEDVTDADVTAAVEWAEALTTAEHTGCVEALVAALWPEYMADAEDWRAALQEWLTDEREREREHRERREARGAERSVTDATVTPRRRDVLDAVGALDVEAVAEDTIVAAWNDDANTSDGARAFYPVWDPNCNGRANIVVEDKNIAVDTGDRNKKGGPVEMALYDAGGWAWGEIATGRDWGRGLDALRSLGYDVPVFIPDTTTTDADGEPYGETPYWAVKRAAVALGVLPEDGFVERESDDGGSYEAFPGAHTYNWTLDALEAAGIKHGRERVGGDAAPTREEVGLDKEPADEEEEVKQFLTELKLRQG